MPTVTITISLADAAYLPMFLHNAADRTLNIADSLAETDTDMAADLRAEVSHLDRLADAISEATHAFECRAHGDEPNASISRNDSPTN
jgi:hypothetical protein